MSIKSALINNPADILTSGRIICAVLILFQEPLSTTYWILYLFCGASDVLDGYTARITNTACTRGAAFDSAADIIFVAAILITILPLLSLPVYIWIWIAIIILIRVCSYTLGYLKFNAFSAVHTYLNKAAGALLIILPVLYAAIGTNSAALVCIAATAASCEELLITVKSRELNRECRSILRIQFNKNEEPKLP